MSQRFEPGQVEVSDVVLISGAGKRLVINPLNIVVLNIYEDVSAPTMMCEFAVVDALGVFTELPVIGEETLQFSLRTPLENRERVEYEFFITAVTGVQPSAEGHAEIYSLVGYSIEKVQNGITDSVKKSFNSPIDLMVEDLLTQHLHTKKRIVATPTRGTQKITTTGYTPLQTIDMLRRRASAKGFDTSYLFFETHKGFYFVAAEELIKEKTKVIGDKEFFYINNLQASYRDDKYYRAVIAYSVPSRTDTLNKLHSGSFSSRTYRFDVFTKTLETFDYEYDSQFENANNRAEPNSSTAIGKFKKSGFTQYFVPYDSSRPDTFIAQTIGPSNAYAALLAQNVTQLTVYGDTNLEAGDVVTFTTERNRSIDNREIDELASGNYFVTKLCHSIIRDKNFVHQTTVEMVRSNYGGKVA